MSFREDLLPPLLGAALVGLIAYTWELWFALAAIAWLIIVGPPPGTEGFPQIPVF